ncbi:hypothetical protein D9M71_549930 [compost metagenome]
MHVELLLRLYDENDQLVAPGQFIPAAERFGMMPQIDRWVVRKAFEGPPPRRGSASRSQAWRRVHACDRRIRLQGIRTILSLRPSLTSR